MSYKDVLPIERLSYYRRCLFLWLELYARSHRRVMHPITHQNHFAIRHFVRTYTRNLKTTGCMRRSTYRMTILLSQMSIFVLELDSRYKWRVTPPNTHHNRFLMRKLQVVLECSAYQTTDMLSETFFAWFRVTLEICSGCIMYRKCVPRIAYN